MNNDVELDDLISNMEEGFAINDDIVLFYIVNHNKVLTFLKELRARRH